MYLGDAGQVFQLFWKLVRIHVLLLLRNTDNKLSVPPRAHVTTGDSRMFKRRIYDDELHVHFVTFSCFKRRKLLDHDRAKKVVMGVLASQIHKQEATCVGFVVMPEHVHGLVWFRRPGQLSFFMKQWKQRSSVQIKKLMREKLVRYGRAIDLSEPVWQARYYPFNVYTDEKLHEKLDYMHNNPVAAGLVARAIDWQFSSARHYLLGKSVGVPVNWVD